MLNFKMRQKLDPGPSNEYRCCFCCLHVYHATTLLGMAHLVLHSAAIATCVLILITPGTTITIEHQKIGYDAAVAQNDTSNTPVNLRTSTTLDGDDAMFGLLMSTGLLFVSGLLVMGTRKFQAQYLLPFFTMQVFDFVWTCMTGASYFVYNRSMKRWVGLQSLPAKQWWLEQDEDVLMFVALLFFSAIVMYKCWLMGLVWSCYQFILNHQLRMRSNRNVNASVDVTVDTTNMALPPKYEDAIVAGVGVSTGPAPPPYNL